MVTLNTNIQAATSLRLININAANLARTQQRLSSGLKINTASDDPSGLGIAQALTSQIRGDQMGAYNIQQGLSMLQVADTGVAQISDILQRMRELAVQANNGGLSASQTSALDGEFQSLKTAVDKIAGGAVFNGKTLLDTTPAAPLTAAGAVVMQVGSQQAQNTTIDFSVDYKAATLGIGGADLTNTAQAQNAQNVLDTAITTVSTNRSAIGAKSQELEYLKSTLDSTVIANQDARSRITDADVASEVSNLVRQQLLQQAGTSALSAANFAPQFVLSLLR